MRLIDADALLEHQVEADRMGAMLVVGKGFIMEAPTITPQPDPETGLMPCEYCTNHKSLYDDKYTDVEMVDDFIHVDVSIQYEGWSFGFYINYCPMCGRRLEVEE